MTEEIFKARTRSNKFGKYIIDELERAKEMSNISKHEARNFNTSKPDVIKAALSVGKQETNVYERQIWNDAIEAAAEECEQWGQGVSPKGDIAPEIRKLKK